MKLEGFFSLGLKRQPPGQDQLMRKSRWLDQLMRKPRGQDHISLESPQQHIPPIGQTNMYFLNIFLVAIKCDYIVQRYPICILLYTFFYKSLFSISQWICSSVDSTGWIKSTKLLIPLTPLYIFILTAKKVWDYIIGKQKKQKSQKATNEKNIQI